MINRKTKIIATIGPSSSTVAKLIKMIDSGMNVARVNMSHYTQEDEVRKIVQNIKSASKKSGKILSILFDICGPKIRVKPNIPKGKILIKKNKIYTLGFEKVNIPINNKINFTSVKPGQIVKIDDGKIQFSIVSSRYKYSIQVQALNDGIIYPSKGINFPGIDLNISALTDKDIQDIELGCDLGIDWFAQSFVRFTKDHKEFLKTINNSSSKIPILAKIETPQSIRNIDRLIELYDGILIARGDLGVELPIEQVPILQKMQ